MRALTFEVRAETRCELPRAQHAKHFIGVAQIGTGGGEFAAERAERRQGPFQHRQHFSVDFELTQVR